MAEVRRHFEITGVLAVWASELSCPTEEIGIAMLRAIAYPELCYLLDLEKTEWASIAPTKLLSALGSHTGLFARLPYG